MTTINKINLNGTEYTLGGSGSGNVNESIKQALLQIASKAGYKDTDGQDYYDALYSALYDVSITSISAVFTQGDNMVFSCDSLNSLIKYLIVTVHYDNGTSAELPTGYALSGTLTAGTSTITVSYDGKTSTFTVDVTEGTDVSPSLSSYVSGTSATTVTRNSDGFTISATGTYKFAQVPLALKKNYTYWLFCEQVYTSGDVRIMMRDMTSGGTGAGLGTFIGPNHNVSMQIANSVTPSDQQNWSDSTSPTNSAILFFATWADGGTASITYKNIRVIESPAESE